MQLTKLLFLQETTIFLNQSVNYQVVFRLTLSANGSGRWPESDFVLTVPNGLSAHILWMQTKPLHQTIRACFIHRSQSLLLANDFPTSFARTLLNQLNTLLLDERTRCIWSAEILSLKGRVRWIKMSNAMVLVCPPERRKHKRKGGWGLWGLALFRFSHVLNFKWKMIRRWLSGAL